MARRTATEKKEIEARKTIVDKALAELKQVLEECFDADLDQKEKAKAVFTVTREVEECGGAWRNTIKMTSDLRLPHRKKEPLSFSFRVKAGEKASSQLMLFDALPDMPEEKTTGIDSEAA